MLKNKISKRKYNQKKLNKHLSHPLEIEKVKRILYLALKDCINLEINLHLLMNKILVSNLLSLKKVRKC